MGEDLDANVAEAPGRLLVEAGGPCPKDELGRPRSLFRPGDVLRVSCPLRETEVVSANRFDVCVRWPWRWLHDAQVRRDQASGVDNSTWWGQLCFDRDRACPDADHLFQFDPGLAVLQAGDRCRVGIPPTIVHVLDVSSWCVASRWSLEPPASLAVHVFPHGVPHDLGPDDLLDSLRPYQHEPIRVELLFRPYPHLRDLDVVGDRDGRRWAFCAPWWWVELDHDDASQGLPAPLPGDQETHQEGGQGDPGRLTRRDQPPTHRRPGQRRTSHARRVRKLSGAGRCCCPSRPALLLPTPPRHPNPAGAAGSRSPTVGRHRRRRTDSRRPRRPA